MCAVGLKHGQNAAEHMVSALPECVSKHCTMLFHAGKNVSSEACRNAPRPSHLDIKVSKKPRTEALKQRIRTTLNLSCIDVVQGAVGCFETVCFCET